MPPDSNSPKSTLKIGAQTPQTKSSGAATIDSSRYDARSGEERIMKVMAVKPSSSRELPPNLLDILGEKFRRFQ